MLPDYKSSNMLNEKKFLTIYEDYQRSGLTIREYCSNLRMCEAKFYYWKKRLKNPHSGAKGFVPVVLDQDKSQQLPARTTKPDQSQDSYEICYPNGTSLKLKGQINLEVLRGLLQLNVAADV